ncbi:MAG TPA: DUF308 domain-containing protein [Chthoniobacterales bacterium]|jgi:uncharacterized membrane protein HdeD (DUF308 family)|nr:DUF308 domain-containing protein [Chthoniobacterales bacterium]
MNSKSRAWVITGAILSLFVGLLALSSPLLFSFLIVRFLGLFALVSGVISLFIAIFGKDVAPRGLNAIFALVRIGAGLALLYCVHSGLHLITLIFAVYLIVEGIFDILGAFKIREQRGWIFMLVNGLVTVVLGLMVYAHWPFGSAWVLGLVFGINLLFHGFAQLMLGLSAPKTVG